MDALLLLRPASPGGWRERVRVHTAHYGVAVNWAISSARADLSVGSAKLADTEAWASPWMSEMLRPNVAAARAQSASSVVPRGAGSSVLMVTVTPASRRRANGCSAQLGYSPSTTFDRGHKPSDTPESARWSTSSG